MKTLIKNAHIISPGLDVEGGAVLVEDGKFTQVYGAADALPAADETIDAAGQMLMPGFIDVHSHGAGGADACDGTVEALNTIADCKIKEGVTSWLATTLTLGYETLEKVQLSVAEYNKAPRSVKIPGTHLEGPYVCEKQLGAQNPAFRRDPDFEELKKLHAISPVLIITLAPELPGACDFIAKATALGVRCSAGHSLATYADFLAAKRSGLVHLTHFCNQMTKLHHREIGLVGAGLYCDDVYVEMICDKIHLCPDMIRLAFKAKPIDRILLITDCMEATGLPDGDYQLGGLAVVVSNGAARLASNGALAGSTLQFNIALRNIVEEVPRPLPELIRTTSLNQAENLGLERLGRLEPGYIADIAVLDERFAVAATFIDGQRRK